MFYESIVKEKKHFLHPSAIYASKEPTAVSTILGTCVAVCLYDPVLHIGGINHYIMPWYHEETPHCGTLDFVEKHSGGTFSGRRDSTKLVI